MTSKSYFTTHLLLWNKDDNKREMPWKGEKDPYKIWLSEIILQQTRVQQGSEYYLRFVKTFPTIEKLSAAPEKRIFKLWEGLGYYTRCKNLIATAKFITNEYRGIFPEKYDTILALKGIGPYTAAAIASFGFNLPHAVIDGNVYRVLSRYFGIDVAIDSADGKKLFTRLANELLDITQPGIYNQAIMDLGAIVCKPKLPLCTECPLKKKCKAQLNDMVDKLPVKDKRIVNKKRWFYYFIVEYNGKVYLRKRNTRDIWENLYEFILAERSAVISNIKQSAVLLLNKWLGNTPFKITAISKSYLQQLTHQTITGRFISVEIGKPAKIPGYKAVFRKEFTKLPFPKCITSFLSEKDSI